MIPESPSPVDITTKRRAVAALLSFTVAGAGQVALGRTDRGLVWILGSVVALAGALAGASSARPALMWASIGAIVLIRLLGGDQVAFERGRLVVVGREVRQTPVAGPCELPDLGERGEPVMRRCTAVDETIDGHVHRVVYEAPESPAGIRDRAPVTVPAGHVFVLGDNRDNAHDSRYWGPVPLTLVEGTASFVWWSSGPSGVRWERVGQRIR